MSERPSLSVSFLAPSVYYLIVDPKKARFTGVDLDLFMIGGQLVKSGEVAVSYIVGDFGQEARREVGNFTLIKSVAIGNKNIIAGLLSIFRYLVAFRRAAADVYVASGAGYEVGLFALFCKIFGKKFYYRTASLVDCNGEWARRNGWRGSLYALGLRLADKVITCADSHSEILLQRYNDIKTQYIPSVYTPFPVKRGIDEIDVLWVSTCYPLKQPEAVVRLAQALPDIKITMIMPMSSHFVDYYRKVKSAVEGQKNINLIDHVPVDEIDSYFASSKIFINTSEYEGFPFALLQALIQGVPPVFLKVDPDSIITKQKLGIVADENEEKFRESISALLLDERTRKLYASKCRQYANDCHGAESSRADWISLIGGTDE